MIKISDSNNNKSPSSSGGIGFCGLLTIVFIVLKILGYIEWSWLWVLAPMWIPLALEIIVVLISFVLAIIVTGITALYTCFKDR